jgi:xanthosine utilization system XapX-like protein
MFDMPLKGSYVKDIGQMGRAIVGQSERYAWLSLGVWLALLALLLTRFTAGVEILGLSFGLTIVEQPAAALLATYVLLGVLAAVGEGTLQAVLAVQAGKSEMEADERDKAISAMSQRIGYWYVAAAINVVILHVLANAAFGGQVLPKFDLASLTGVAFARLFILITAEVVERLARLWHYRFA